MTDDVLFEEEPVVLNAAHVKSILDFEQHKERALLTPLPGTKISERASYAVKRLFHGIKRAVTNLRYKGRSMHFESCWEYENWRRKISYP